jgi:small subunit ribosomal protein S20
LANHKSAAKRARQSVKRAARRSSYKSSVRTAEKTLRKSITAKDTKGAAEALKAFMSKIAKASKTNIFHPRAAARKIARLSSAVSSLK